MDKYDLPSGWEWKLLNDPSICTLNPPKREIRELPDSLNVSFVPMANLDDISGRIQNPLTRKLGEVKKGYTYFIENDVVFAKITPCMENGKSAVARNLCNGIGFGTTEFHVLRPGKKVVSEWLHLFVRRKDFREAARDSMCGGAGQQRVPQEFLEQVEIPVPPLPVQQRIVARIEELTKRLDHARQLRQQAIGESASTMAAYLQNLLQESEKKGWKQVQLGNKDVCQIVMGQSPLGTSYNFDKKGVPLLNGPTEFGAVHPTPVQWTTEPTRFCQKDDILFCVRGSTTGRMNWADQTYCLGRGLAAIRPNSKRFIPVFVFATIQVQVAAILHRAEGGVFPNFNKDQLQVLQIPEPPRPEQKRIADILQSLQNRTDELQKLQTEVYTQLESFLPALLAKAFRGEL